jgi:hypothetical protein
MLGWMKSNRTWVFSGCGVAVLSGIFGVLSMTQHNATDSTNVEKSSSVSIDGNATGSTVVAAMDSSVNVHVTERERTLEDDDPPAPTIGDFKTRFGDTTYVIYEDKNGALHPTQITLIIDVPRDEQRNYDHFAIFDITNVAKADLRIVSLAFRTTKWRPLEELKYYVPLAGLEPMQAYFVVIDKETRDYDCKLVSNSADFAHVLKAGELDTIKLAFTALSQGVYDGEINLTYSVNGKVRSMVVGTVKDIHFVDREFAFSIPRGEEKQREMVRARLLKQGGRGK